ncbi:CDP-glycerol glycerophosphotransferase family protein [Demequina sp. B12]|uniref:CDP-glycerol glycerophosphotransferase family protein n=1 Tax=Demequina sp. B12 TaxID=2992757 RepID=UPI00237B2AA3|nr:CDP-glycerol glycerophosphotransferase family protein [Demequina sp. B12]MDE0572538.1 CDP-glycerol glycerophosphotransferase family protein [Demequina sp. B12]
MGKARKFAGSSIRRLGLLPGGIPDGLGEDEKLTGYVIRSQAVVFFPDPPENVYQLRQWYGALDALDERMGLTVVTQDSRTAKIVRAETPFPVIIVARNRTFSALLRRGHASIVIYVGHANNNMVGLRATEAAHVFLAHGDSDKAVSVSNQVKGFDFTFVAGQAAVDRYAASVMFFDTAAHLRIIGRPQLPSVVERETGSSVLYAPTWEGSQETNAYSSAVSHGERLVQSLLDDGFQVIYRPHPRLGVSDRAFREANSRIKDIVTAAGAQGEVDVTPDPNAAMERADVLITDVSAMSSDWLSQGRALLVTTPVVADAQPTPGSRLHAQVPRITAEQASDTATLVRAAMADEGHLATIRELADYYLGGLSAEEATDAFVDACVEASEAFKRELHMAESRYAQP